MSQLWLAVSAAQLGEQTSPVGALPAWREADVSGKEKEETPMIYIHKENGVFSPIFKLFIYLFES